MLVTQFHAPANLKEFDGPMAKAWSDWVSRQIDSEVQLLAQENPGIHPQFYNASKLDISGTPAPISWPGFPNKVEIDFGDDPEKMFQQAELRNNQDEYLEWATVKQQGKITKVMFTCEGPEYWRFIAQNDPNLLVSLYSKVAGQPVPKGDLLTTGGLYRPTNKWNAAFAVHLVQPANNLGAEIDIAAQATVLRRHGTHDPVTDAIELIRCSIFGDEERNSDPHIGDIVNQKARLGCSVTLQDPIGLYIESMPTPEELEWRKPDGSLVGDYWQLERGDNDHMLRLVYEVPAGELSNGKPFVVGDITIEGDPITFGGQLAKFLRVKLTGIIGQEGVFHNQTFPCRGSGPFAIMAPGTTSRRA